MDGIVVEGQYMKLFPIEKDGFCTDRTWVFDMHDDLMLLLGNANGIRSNIPGVRT